MRPLPLVLALGGCAVGTSKPLWVEQLHPDGPCYDANLLDGLDEDSTDELHAVFACVNSTGALNALAPIDRSFDGSTRDGSVGHVLAVEVNSLSSTSFSIPSLLTSVRGAMDERDQWTWVLHLGMELIYGRPYGWLGQSVELQSQTELDAGLLAPLSDTLGAGSGAILDDQMRPLEPVKTLLRSEALPQLAWTASALGQSTDPTLKKLADHWAFDTADALEKAADTSNNRSGGDSLRGLVEALLVQRGEDGRSVLAHLSDPLLPILEDGGTQSRIRSWLASENDAGRLGVLAPQLLYLASVNVDGDPLKSGEDSALHALVRLLHDANRDIHCRGTILGIYDFDVALGNLAVQLLILLGQQDPGTVDGAVGLLGSALGVDWLTGSLLDLVPNVCSDITPQMVDDIYALDRLNDPQASGLLYALLYGLRALDGHVPELVDLLTIAYDYDVVPPLEEALRDLASASLVGDVLSLIPVLLEPDQYFDKTYFPTGVTPVSFEDVWGMLQTVLTPDDQGLTPLDYLDGPLQAALAEEGTWTAVAHLGALLGQQEAELPGILSHLDQLLQTDPELSFAPDLADLLDDTDQIQPLLVILESSDFRDAIFQTAPTVEGPLPFLATLVIGGTLDVLLDTVSLLLTLFPEEK